MIARSSLLHIGCQFYQVLPEVIIYKSREIYAMWTIKLLGLKNSTCINILKWIIMITGWSDAMF